MHKNHSDTEMQEGSVRDSGYLKLKHLCRSYSVRLAHLIQECISCTKGGSEGRADTHKCFEGEESK